MLAVEAAGAKPWPDAPAPGRPTRTRGRHHPADLMPALLQNPVAATCFAGFPCSSRRLILGWIAQAERPETRGKRIVQTVAAASATVRAHHPGVSAQPRV